jgi:hypothetical protein
MTLLARRIALRIALPAMLLGTAARGDGPSVLADGLGLIAGSIYETTVEVGKLPVEWVKPGLIRWKVGQALDPLPLPADVRARVRAAVASERFVDGIVPFVLDLQEQYAEPGSALPTFDDAVRLRFSRSVPGIENARFSFSPPPRPKGPKRSIDPALVAGFVRLYDALFLTPGRSPFDRAERADAATIERVRPIVEELLRRFAAMAPHGSESETALLGLLADREKSEALSISLVDAVDRIARDSYSRFAAKVARGRDLDRWLAARIGEGGFDRLEGWLRASGEGRRLAVGVVVDGLEGRLVEALANGEGDDPFLRGVAQQHRSSDPPPKSLGATPAPVVHTRFLESFVAKGFRAPGYLPFFRRLFARFPNGISEGGISTTPTISVRNLPIAETGATVAGAGGTGIPNFHFVDRKSDRAWYFYGNDALSLRSIVETHGAKTLFERLPGRTGISGYAQYDQGAAVSFDPLVNLAIGEKRRDWGERRLFADLERRAGTERRLAELRRDLLSRLPILRGSKLDPRRPVVLARAKRVAHELAGLADDGLPDFLLWYDPWPDHFAHFDGPFSDELVSPSGELNRLDHWLGRLDAAYRRAGVADRTLFGLAGDHGLAPVFHFVSPEKAVFDPIRAEGIPLVVRKISADEGEGPTLVHPWHPPSMRGVDLVVASTAGGSYVVDAFLGQGPEWVRQPLLGELRSWKTLAGATLDLPAQLVDRLGPSLDYLVVRTAPSGPDGGGLALLARRGGRTVEARIDRRGDRIRYLSPEDLLGIARVAPWLRLDPRRAAGREELLGRCLAASRSEEPSGWCREEEWRRLAAPTERPDSVVQLAHLHDVDEAGTLNLFPAPGYAWNSVVPGRHAGELFAEKDPFVGFWGGTVRGRARLGPAMNGSMAPTLYEWLTGRAPKVGEEGWGFPSLLRSLRPDSENETKIGGD